MSHTKWRYSMFRKVAISVGLGLAISVPAQAQQYIGKVYKWEVDADYTTGEYSGNFDDTEFDNAGISGSYFFGGVNNTKGPYSEAAFLDHASDITASYKYREIDDNGIDVDGDEYGISGRYVTDGAGWILQGSYTRLEPVDAEIDTYTIGAGKYLGENTTLLANYWNGDVDDGGDTDGASVGLEHFWALSSGGIKLEGNYGFVNVDDADDIDIYNLTGTWYVNNNLGFGAGYGNFDAGGFEAEQYTAFAEWFVTKGIAANLEYVHQELDDTDFEVDSIALGVRLRY